MSVMMKNQFILRINFERKKTQEDNFQRNCSHKKIDVCIMGLALKRKQ